MRLNPGLQVSYKGSVGWPAGWCPVASSPLTVMLYVLVRSLNSRVELIAL